MTLSDDDYALVNAFHDGELDAGASAALRARLKDEPELRRALAEVSEISSALKALRPEQGLRTAPPVRNRQPLKVAVAACLALGIVFGGLVLHGHRSTPVTPADWHSHFVSQSYLAEDGLRPAAAMQWIGQEPDLSAASLMLVDFANHGPGDAYLHYSGANGCRLTFGTHAAEPGLPQRQPDVLAESWSMNERHFSVLAVGMDHNRFRAIAALLKEKTRQDTAGPELYAQVRDATTHGLPCA